MRGEYKIGALIEELNKHFNVVSLASLARKLELTPQKMGVVARGVQPISAYYLLRIHEATGWNVAYIRHILGDESELPFEPPKKKDGKFYWDDGVPAPRRGTDEQRAKAMKLLKRSTLWG